MFIEMFIKLIVLSGKMKHLIITHNSYERKNSQEGNNVSIDMLRNRMCEIKKKSLKRSLT
jgi:hypothetical protein